MEATLKARQRRAAPRKPSQTHQEWSGSIIRTAITHPDHKSVLVVTKVSRCCLSRSLGLAYPPAHATMAWLVFAPLLPWNVRSWQDHHVPVHIDDKRRGTEGAMHKNTGTALNLTLFPSARPAWSTRKVSTGLLGLLRLDSHQTSFSPTAIQYQQSLSRSTIYFKSIPRTKFQVTNNDVQRQPLHLAQLSRRSGLPPKYKSRAHRAPLCCDVLLWNADRNGMGPRKNQSTCIGDFIHYPALRQPPLSPSPDCLPLAGPIVAHLPRLRMREAEAS